MYQADPEKQQKFRRYAIAKLSPVMEKFGWIARPGEPAIAAEFRSGIIATLSEMGDEKTLAEARRRYAAMDTDPSALPVELKRLVMYIVARHADNDTWEALHAKAVAETSQLLKQSMYGMLASSNNKEIAQKALKLALSAEPDVTVSSNMIGSVAGSFPDMAFDFAIENLQAVNERVDATSRSRFFPALASGSNDPK